MKVGKLRECNILLHLNITATKDKERVPDLPAVYLVEPTNDNFKRIASDA